MKASSILIIISSMVFCLSANAKDSCYNLFSPQESGLKLLKLCIQTKSQNPYYSPTLISLKTVGTNSVVFESNRFQLIDKSPCLDCNKMVYNVIYKESDKKSLGFYNKYHNYPIEFKGNINIESKQEVGSITMGGEKYQYYKSNEVGIERGLASK